MLKILITFFFESYSPFQMYEATISGQAFLWHQVRYMIAILFLIGMELEDAKVCVLSMLMGDPILFIIYRNYKLLYVAIVECLSHSML